MGHQQSLMPTCVSGEPSVSRTREGDLVRFEPCGAVHRPVPAAVRRMEQHPVFPATTGVSVSCQPDVTVRPISVTSSTSLGRALSHTK
jgi:hypothetical protein